MQEWKSKESLKISLRKSYENQEFKKSRNSGKIDFKKKIFKTLR